MGWLCLASHAAFASHFRYGTVSWMPVSGTNVEFKIKVSYRKTAFFSGAVAVGSTFAADAFYFGDGASAVPTFTVTSFNLTDDWIAGEATVTHTYPSTAAYTANYGNTCCRISNLNNNSGGNYRVETLVRPGSTNSSPVSSLPPIVTVGVGATAGFVVPASDLDRDPIRFRLATAAETGLTTNAPPNFSINATTGRVTWDNRTLNQTNFWMAQIVLEDLDANGNVKSKTALDLLLKIQATVGSAPTLTINPTGPLSVRPNTPVTFTLTATDPDAGAKISLSSSGLPVGATMTPALGPSLTPPVTSTFNWTPTAAQAGSYTISFSATDDTFQQVLGSVSIFVETNRPPTVAGLPAALNVPSTSAAGADVTLDAQVLDPNGDAVTVVWKVDGATVQTNNVPAGGSAATNLSLTRTLALGAHTVVVTATDGNAASASASSTVTVTDNQAPVTTASAPGANAAGWSKEDVQLTLAATDGGSGVKEIHFSAAGALALPATVVSGASATLPISAEGITAVTYYAVDNAGNAEAAKTVTVRLDKAAPVVTVNAPANTTYTLGQSVAVDYACADSGSGPDSCVGPVAVGGALDTTSLGAKTFTVTATDVAGNSATVTVNYTVTKANTTTTLASNKPAATYGDAVTLTATVAGAGGTPTGSVEFFDGANSLGTATLNNGSASLVTSALRAGTHTVTAVYAESDHYLGSTSAAAAQDVAKATPHVVVNGGSYTYDALPHPATGGEATGIGGAALPQPTVSYADAHGASTGVPVNAGTYQVTASFAGDDNYEAATQTATIEIAKAHLSVKADDQARAYGAANPALTGTLTGVVGGDGISASYSTAATAASTVGTYAIVPTLVDPAGKLGNYEVSSTNGTLTINKARQTITWATPAEIVYGTTLGGAQLNAIVSVAGPAPAGAATYTPAAGAIPNGGAQTLSVMVAETENYLAASATVTLNVRKAASAFSNLNSPMIFVGAATTTLAGRLTAGAMIPAGEAVTVTVGGMTQSATLQADGSFAADFSTAALAAANPAYAIRYSYAGSGNFNGATAAGTLTVCFDVKSLFDQTKVSKSGSTIPVKVQAVGAGGANLSSAGLAVKAVGIRQVSASAYGTAEDAGNANPDLNFRYDASLAGYIFNLKTTGLATGTYVLGFTVGNDPVVHTVQFQIK